MRSASTPSVLANVCEFIVDCLHATAPIQESGIPLIRTPNIGRGMLLLDDVYRVSEPTYREWTRRAVPLEGDLILAREAPAGNVAVIRSAQTVCLGQRTVHLRPDRNQVDPRYLCYFLLAPKQQGLLLAGETGATAKHVNMKDIRRLPLEGIPPLDVQRKTANLIANYDDLIENNRRRIALLEYAARLLYEEWFVRFRFPGHQHVELINGLPDGWLRVPLGEVLTLKRGYDLPSSTRVDGEVPVVSSAGITGYHNQVQAKAPGIVTGRYGTLGQVYFIQRDFWPLNTALYVSDFKGLQPEFALHLLRNVLASWQSDKAAVPGIDRKVVHKFPVIVPPESLRAQFSSFASPVYKQIFTLENASLKSENARDLLLPRLMSGEVEV